MTIIPHLAFPFRFTDAGRAAINEQGTLEEIEACVAVILSYRIGDRIELDEFGIPDPTFSQGGVDTGPILAAVQRWEPRAQAVAESEGLTLGEYVDRVAVNVQQP